MEVAPIRVGIVGAGANTVQRHIPGLRAMEGVEIVAVCNRSRDSSERVAEAQAIPEVSENWRSLVAHPGVDAVLIGTWPYMHHSVTLAAIAAGKHVLCEARMAMNAGEAHEMLAAARLRPDLVTQIVPSPLSFEVDATISRLLSTGFVGRLLTVDVEARSGDFPDPGAPLHWRQDFDLSGFNIMSLGIWYESVMRWVGEAAEVFATGSVSVPQRTDPAGRLRAVRIPDHVDVLARLVSGAQARFQISECTGPASARATLAGTEGILRFERGRLFGARRGGAALEPLDVPPTEVGRWRVEEEFVNSIRGLEQVKLTDFATGVKYMEFTEAVWRSMQRRRAVALPLAFV